MQNKKTFYLTTAIAYASGKPHIGNTYEIILADSIVRFKRLQGYDVRFQTGTDEHGQKIEGKARAAGVDPKTFVDGVAGEIKDVYKLMNISYDRFIRTTDPDHEKQVQKIFRKFYDQGDIYKGCYEGWYCTACESFFTKSQLVDGRCPDCGGPVHEEKEEAYFFRMSKYAPRLIQYINDHPDFIQPESRKNEMMNNFLLPGLQDLCVSRTSFKWGIPVDFDPKHVIYVWIDALSNYITGLGYDVDGNSDPMFEKYWPADIHLIGKDIIRFHTIYWPIMLMALGLPLPKQVFGHPWLLQGEGKMSKSKGNVIYADELVRFFGVDAVRYFCIHEMPFDNDGVISWDLMIDRNNSDLANTLGNLVKRTVSMTNKYFGGVLRRTGAEEPLDSELKELALHTYSGMSRCMDTLHAADALTALFSLFKRCNKYIDETQPWVLARDEAKMDRLSEVLYNLSESIMIGASLLQPFMPETAERIAGEFNVPLRKADQLNEFGLIPDGTRVTENPTVLFARLDPAKTMEEVNALMEQKKAEAAAKAAADGTGKQPGDGSKSGSLSAGSPASEAAGEKKQNAPADGSDGCTAVKDGNAPADGAEPVIDLPAKPEISYDDFAKLQFRVGRILSCERVPKSKKLLVSKVQVGSEVRQIVSGIQKWYTPEEMTGKKVMVLTNLKPAVLAGVRSEGMILCAEDAEGNVCLVNPEKDVPAGSEIR